VEIMPLARRYAERPQSNVAPNASNNSNSYDWKGKHTGTSTASSSSSSWRAGSVPNGPTPARFDWDRIMNPLFSREQPRRTDIQRMRQFLTVLQELQKVPFGLCLHYINFRENGLLFCIAVEAPSGKLIKLLSEVLLNQIMFSKSQSQTSEAMELLRPICSVFAQFISGCFLKRRAVIESEHTCQLVKSLLEAYSTVDEWFKVCQNTSLGQTVKFDQL
jgi:hypothetical protein